MSDPKASAAAKDRWKFKRIQEELRRSGHITVEHAQWLCDQVRTLTPAASDDHGDHAGGSHP